MARPEITGRKISAIEGDRDAFSVEEFCKRHGISVQLFYKLKADMPTTFRVGTRVLISRKPPLAGALRANLPWRARLPDPAPTAKLNNRNTKSRRG